MDMYEARFDPNSWEDASIMLPYELSKKHPDLVHVIEPEVFFVPTCWEVHQIFGDLENTPIADELVTLHLWQTLSEKYIAEITGWDWVEKHASTMYARLAQPFYTKCIISNNCYGGQYYKKNNKAYNTPFVNMFMHAPCYILLLENFTTCMSMTPTPATTSKYGPIERGSVATLNDEIELHFYHEDDVEVAIRKWEKRKKRLPPLHACDVKLCDRDSFSIELGRRFEMLGGYKSKTLFLSTTNSRSFLQHVTPHTTTVHSLSSETTPDGFMLERIIPY